MTWCDHVTLSRLRMSQPGIFEGGRGRKTARIPFLSTAIWLDSVLETLQQTLQGRPRSLLFFSASLFLVSDDLLASHRKLNLVEILPLGRTLASGRRERGQEERMFNFCHPQGLLPDMHKQES